jgi:hypothetical protein
MEEFHIGRGNTGDRRVSQRGGKQGKRLSLFVRAFSLAWAVAGGSNNTKRK